ncbi:hypothetical protein G9A89_006300 [Geosiphon pyriformis]|nr:hypothetical protein G9A89_006300 [Geosiphon pyriformis]
MAHYGSFFKLAEILQIIAESENDQDLRLMAQEEYNTMKRILEIERKIVSALLPKDNADQGNAILEVRAVSIFNFINILKKCSFKSDILIVMIFMYERYAVLSEESSADYFSVSINSGGVLGNLKDESGVHRVQRIPATEKQGRVHTSIITVAILPEPTEDNVKLSNYTFTLNSYINVGDVIDPFISTSNTTPPVTVYPNGNSVPLSNGNLSHAQQSDEQRLNNNSLSVDSGYFIVQTEKEVNM